MYYGGEVTLRDKRFYFMAMLGLLGSTLALSPLFIPRFWRIANAVATKLVRLPLFVCCAAPPPAPPSYEYVVSAERGATLLQI